MSKVTTKNAIAYAFKELLLEKPINKITINDIAEKYAIYQCIFTTEYSIRTGMEAVYTLLNVDRGVPEVWGSQYDVRELLRACYYAVDKKSVQELPLSLKERVLLKNVLKAIKGTDVESLLQNSGLLK